MRVLSQMGVRITSEVLERMPGIEVVDIGLDEPLGPDHVADVLLATHWSAALADIQAPIPWVHLFGTGVDGVAPGLFAADRLVTCSRGAGAIPISEFVLATMLAFEKQLPDVWVNEAPAQWSRARLGALHGRTLGVVGLGGIGSEVARLGRAFGMDVRALRRTAAASPVEGVAVVTDLADLVRDAHHVVLTAPSTPKTRRMIDASALAAMRPGVHLVNISRGALIDHDALHEALDSGQVARATLDVSDPEPPPAGHWLYHHRAVRLSPHISWSSPAMMGFIVDKFVANLEARRDGRPLSGVVDIAEGY
jgi:phosphoglycerate dehydrogenase-like enzyme